VSVPTASNKPKERDCWQFLQLLTSSRRYQYQIFILQTVLHVSFLVQLLRLFAKKKAVIMAPIPLSVKVAVLDDYAKTAPEHFDSLSNVSVTYIPDTTPLPYNDERIKAQAARLKDFTVICTMRERTPFPRALLSQLPNLKVLTTTGMKNASIDIAACEDLGITVTGTGGKPNSKKGYDATNEQTWALITGLAKGVFPGHDAVTKTSNGWSSGTSMSLAGKTLGLLGLGRLGAQCGFTGYLGFGMDVLCWSSSLTQEKADDAAAERGIGKGIFKVAASKEELFEKADVLSVHYVLSDRSRGIVGKDELVKMKKGAIIVNTSRGPLIDEQALLSTLKEGKIRGAALDVFDIEPLPADSEWRTVKWGQDGKSDVLISPHMGYVEDETMNSWYYQTAQNVERWLKGEEVRAKLTASANSKYAL
jgi:phosphoglycerate dehydrogenase-like enzyme